MDLCWQSTVSAFEYVSRLLIAFLPRSKRLLIPWLQSPSGVILEPQKIKSATVSTISPSICHEAMGLDAMILVFWMLSCPVMYLLRMSGHMFLYKMWGWKWSFCFLPFPKHHSRIRMPTDGFSAKRPKGTHSPLKLRPVDPGTQLCISEPGSPGAVWLSQSPLVQAPWPLFSPWALGRYLKRPFLIFLPQRKEAAWWLWLQLLPAGSQTVNSLLNYSDRYALGLGLPKFLKIMQN